MPQILNQVRLLHVLHRCPKKNQANFEPYNFLKRECFSLKNHVVDNSFSSTPQGRLIIRIAVPLPRGEHKVGTLVAHG
jgi:hypothetical protein